MTDVGIGGGAPPASAGAGSSAPSQGGGEAVINPSPVNIPAPVSNQVTDQSPQKPSGDSADFKAARRETIAKAFERARTDPVPTQRAKPGPGHNQPPEPTPKEKPAEKPRENGQPPLDLKKRPVPDEEPGKGAERTRGEHGRFAARTGPDGQQNPPGRNAQNAAGQGVQQGVQYVNPLPPHAPYREPPSRGMSQAAQRDWGTAPESVRGDMHRMFKEFSRAAQQMRADRQVMNTIRPYHEMARQQGTTLARALGNYVPMERKLRSDPIGGLDVIVNNLNLRTQDGRRLGLRDIAYHVLNQSPEQLQLTQSQNAQGALAQQLAQVQQRQQALEYHQARMHHAAQFAQTRGAVDRFAETHPRLDELGWQVEQELKLGFDLPTAYRRAELLHPAGSATQAAKTRTTPGETRSDRSITGAPDSSLNGGPRRQKPSANPREAVANAIRVVNGR
jgi:hypothetical protein